jgi:hypothetical protein
VAHALCSYSVPPRGTVSTILDNTIQHSEIYAARIAMHLGAAANYSRSRTVRWYPRSSPSPRPPGAKFRGLRRVLRPGSSRGYIITTSAKRGRSFILNLKLSAAASVCAGSSSLRNKRKRIHHPSQFQIRLSSSGVHGTRRRRQVDPTAELSQFPDTTATEV